MQRIQQKRAISNKSCLAKHLWLTRSQMLIQLPHIPDARASIVNVYRPKFRKRRKNVLLLSFYRCISERSGAPTVKTPQVLFTVASMISSKKSGCFCVKIAWLRLSVTFQKLINMGALGGQFAQGDGAGLTQAGCS